MQELENILNIKARPINSDDWNKRQCDGWLRSYGFNQFYDEQRKLGILSRFSVMDDGGFFKSFHYTKINDLRKYLPDENILLVVLICFKKPTNEEETNTCRNICLKFLEFRNMKEFNSYIRKVMFTPLTAMMMRFT